MTALYYYNCALQLHNNMNNMNNEQELALQMAMQGHSFLLLGAAGTGKTFVTKEIISSLKKEGKSVLIASSTGIACTPFSTYGAQTAHKLFGLRDGRYTLDQLTHLFAQGEDKYEERRVKIKGADVLIIDEVSMISKNILGKIEHVVRTVKANNLVMGGLQTIFVGDFYQLAPVPAENMGDNGDFCFQHPLFPQIVPHRCELLEVMRQDEQLLVNAINELAHGTPTATTITFVRSLNTPLNVPPRDKKVLVSLNVIADIENAVELEKVNKPSVKFISTDSGNAVYLTKFKVQKVSVTNKNTCN